MAESTPQSTGHEISQSSRSDEIITAVEYSSGQSPLIEPVILSTELVSSNRVLYNHETATVTTDDETDDEQQELAQRQRLEKTAKFSCSVALTLSIAIIIAVVDNTSKSGSKSRSELILLKASAALALVTFFAGIGLLISVQYKDVKRTILVGLIMIAAISELAGVVVLAMSIII
ncbi:hypothetical protein MA16_Dca010299 [Dendrobium catenatum]|uniref:Uncharacterized protein n=1 Tax=Dendrobium catenatum TaxID=906689 RepID=A0A2I0W3G1_9ASPA|nr:hypothetical protein MA16_Dca010299 [Dendrobium catenatum]